MFNFQFYISILLFLVLLANDSSCQKTINVPFDYSTIQEALHDSNEFDTILVEPGTYFENLKWPFNKDLHLIGKEGKETTIIDGGRLDYVIQMDSLTESSLLEGFTIKNGQTPNEGAGIFAQNSGIKLKNLIVTDNIAEGKGGGGAFLKSHYGDIDSCQFNYNTIIADNGINNGIGLFLDIRADVEISNCDFSDNKSLSSFTNSVIRGGGLYVTSTSLQSFAQFVLLRNCSFLNNILEGGFLYGAGIAGFGTVASPLEVTLDSCKLDGNECKAEASYGGAISLVTDINLFLNNCTITDNDASAGSAVYYTGIVRSGTMLIRNCLINSNVSSYASPTSQFHCALNLDTSADCLIVNSEISNNQGRSLFSYLYVLPSTINITNTTIAYNEKPIYLYKTDLEISESILRNNEDVEFEDAVNSGILLIENSIVKGGHPGNNIIDSDPLFTSEEILIPTDGSPCINAGDPSSPVTDDLLGNPRPMPPGSNPDLGAYEVNQEAVSSTKRKPIDKFIVFPNPTSDWIYFSERMDLVEVYNTDGKLLKNGRKISSINLKDLVEGIYTIQMKNQNGSQNQKMILVR